MNFYEAVVKYNEFELPFPHGQGDLFPYTNGEDAKRWLQETFREVNNNLGVRCDDDCALSVFVYSAGIGEVNIIFSVDTDLTSLEDAKKFIEIFFGRNYMVCDVEIYDVNEITTSRFHQLGEKGDSNGLINRFRTDEADLGTDYRNNNQYHINEALLNDEDLTYDEAVSAAKNIMADESFIEELGRIYSDENEKKYYGNPVHYKISASNSESAYEMALLLAQALKANGRLAGKRINRISEIKERCYDEEDFEHMFNYAHGNIVILELSGSSEEHGNYASAYEDVIEYIDSMVRKNHVKTLCIFVENTNRQGFAGKLLAKVAENIDIIEIKEGCGDRNTAISYISNLAIRAGNQVSDDEIKEMLPDKQIFTVGDAYEVYDNCFKNGLKNKIYKSYKNCTTMQIRKEDKKSNPYDELQKMVGLAEIKKVVDEVIDSARIQKLRSDMGMDSYMTSLHMIFTGNPGSAKTTVARIIAQIFLNEGILKSGKFVECGRSDLVGKYVGWTAKTVQGKFREAKGGILFIDEAYSLVDDSNSFGDEAINTIVQEMENNRDDVIVIFAGYPDKMQDFLAKNEGLRSRIAFHLDFPDYNAGELLEILKLMAGQKGYCLDKGIYDKCYDIFNDACQCEQFGNGRFVRNLLEQAMIAQSCRIIRENRGKKVSRKALKTMKEEDFNVNITKQFQKDKKNHIGFVV